MLSGGDAEARPALPTRFYSLFTVQCLCQIYGQGCLAHVGLSYKQIGMSQTIALKAVPQQLHGLGLTDNIPHSTLPLQPDDGLLPVSIYINAVAAIWSFLASCGVCAFSSSYASS
jgi:hypothetical protein